MYMYQAIPFADPEIQRLDFLLEKVKVDTDLPGWRRASVASSIRMTGEWLGLELAAVPAVNSFLTRRFQTLSPGVTGASKKRLQNALSDLRFGLNRYGLAGPRTYLAPLTGVYKELAAKLTDKYRKIPLTRFLRYLAFHNIPLDQAMAWEPPWIRRK